MTEKREKAWPVLLFILISLLLIPGCAGILGTECTHTDTLYHEGLPATFFAGGSISHYRCADCERLLSLQKEELAEVSTPRLSTGLSVCVNGSPAPLEKQEESPNRITWSLDGMSVAAGDVITICDSLSGTVYAYFGNGNLDETGRIQRPAAEASIHLTATPNGLTLRVSDECFSGPAIQINGRLHPMRRIRYGGSWAYTYGYAQWKPGDSFLIIDTASGTTYGYASLSEDSVWNRYDYHCGENGEFVIDREARYRLDFSRDADPQISITKVLAPTAAEGCRVVFRNREKPAIAMEEVLHDTERGAFAEFVRYSTGEVTENSADIAAFIEHNGVKSYSCVLFLEAGTEFAVEQGGSLLSEVHLTQVLGAQRGIGLRDGYIQVLEAGTYRIRYLPSSGSISVEQLTKGGLSEAAREFDKRIVRIQSVCAPWDDSGITALYEEYLGLPAAVKNLLLASDKLEAMYRQVQATESAPVTYYVNPSHSTQVYPSREALFRSFFTDFYYYITVYHGTERLRQYGIGDADAFLTLAQDYNGAGATDLCGIGYVAGKYLLESRSNSTLDEQGEGGFFGFCRKNGLYEELLPFFFRFFAYWRLDEHFANTMNCGADIFAEGWAPTVDIAKFFYYDENSSYVKTDRVLDCFTNTACVVYGLDSETALPQPRLRGYIFEGWYDNPQWEGSPVTQLPADASGITLYAKWREDQKQRDMDSAALVDVYIYNLTTAAALRSRTTIGNAKALYDSLTPKAKGLVQQLPTLENYLSWYRTP